MTDIVCPETPTEMIPNVANLMEHHRGDVGIRTAQPLPSFIHMNMLILLWPQQNGSSTYNTDATSGPI